MPQPPRRCRERRYHPRLRAGAGSFLANKVGSPFESAEAEAAGLEAEGGEFPPCCLIRERKVSPLGWHGREPSAGESPFHSAMRRRHHRRTNPMGGRSELIGSQPRRGAPHFSTTAETAANSDLIGHTPWRRQLGQLNPRRLVHAGLFEGTSTVGSAGGSLCLHR